jgi:Heparinase II/III-like protein
MQHISETSGILTVLSINRRQMITGLTALLGQAHLPMGFGLEQAQVREDNALTGANVATKSYLGARFTPEFLSQNLIAVADWRPYPKASEREAWQSIPPDIRATLIKRAEAILGTEWPALPATLILEFKEDGNRTHYEQLYFMRRQRLTALVVAECAEGKGRFLHEIVNGVWLICEESFWGLPAHLVAQKGGAGLPNVSEPIIDLFAAETGATLAWVYYLVGAGLDQVSPLVTPRIQMEAKRRILDPGLSRNDFSWMGLNGSKRRLNNWTPWINSNWLETNLLLETDPARRVATTCKICRSLDRFLVDYSTDGGCEEGPGYWEVSAGSYFDCCSALVSATGCKQNVLSDPFVQQMGHYIVDVHIADHYYVNYGDAHAKLDHPPELLYRFGAAVQDPVLAGFGAFRAANQSFNLSGQGRLARDTTNVLSVAKARNAPKADALVREAWYPTLGLMTTRAEAGTSDGFYLSVQAARNNRSHGHYDSGSFIVFHDGKPVFIDVGVEAYTAKTFSADRFSIWTMQSAFHNLPTINSVMQRGSDDTYRASEVHFDSTDAYTGLSMDLETAYPLEAGIRHWRRDIRLERVAHRITLTEDFELQKKVPVQLSFMTPRVPSERSKGTIVLSAPDNAAKEVSLRYDTSLADCKVEKIVLKDAGLRDSWGDNIYRVLLTSREPADAGKWVMEIESFPNI